MLAVVDRVEDIEVAEGIVVRVRTQICGNFFAGRFWFYGTKEVLEVKTKDATLGVSCFMFGEIASAFTFSISCGRLE